MNLREIEYMISLDRNRSITAAARELHLTQPTLSIFLTNLEKEQGGLLFERIGKKLYPTRLGTSYLSYAHQIAALNTDFELEKAEILKEASGEFHFGCLERKISGVLPREVRRFQENHLGIRLILHSSNAENMTRQLLEGALDMIYINTPLDENTNYSDKLTERVIRTDYVLLVLPQGHPAESKAIQRHPSDPYPWLDLCELQNETFYVSRPGRALREKTDRIFRSCHIQPEQIPVPTVDIGCQLAAEGLGAAFIMESYIPGFHYDKPVNYYLTGNIPAVFTWRLLWRSSTILTGYMRDFINQLDQRSSLTPRRSGSDENLLR